MKAREKENKKERRIEKTIKTTAIFSLSFLISYPYLSLYHKYTRRRKKVKEETENLAATFDSHSLGKQLLYVSLKNN